MYFMFKQCLIQMNQKVVESKDMRNGLYEQ